MRHPSGDSIGERIRQLRRQQDPPLTQQQLAERAGVSVDLIRKLEQGVKQTCLLTNLHKIARALDVDAATLLGQPARVNTATGEQPHEPLEGGILAIRRAITDPSPGEEPVRLGELYRSISYAEHVYVRSRFDVLGGLLPGLVTAARATAAAAPTPEALGMLADIYELTARTLTLLGRVDLAYLAMERAVTAADQAGDGLRRVAFDGRLSWVLLHQTSSADQAFELAVAAADRAEPRRATPTREALAVWSGLLTAAAVAAARDGRQAEADELLRAAEAATAMDAAGPVYDLIYGVPYGQAHVVMQQVDVSLVTGRPGRALDAARRMPAEAPTAMTRNARGRHLADVACAQAALGRDREAVSTLLSIEREAPAWLRYQPYPRAIVRELLERERRARTPALRGLAQRLGIA